MSFDEYQEETARTWKFGTDDIDSIFYLGLGLNGEAGEVAEHIKKVFFHGKTFDDSALAYELGDVLWYLARLAAEGGYSLQRIAEMNIQKLRERHGVN